MLPNARTNKASPPYYIPDPMGDNHSIATLLFRGKEWRWLTTTVQENKVDQ